MSEEEEEMEIHPTCKHCGSGEIFGYDRIVGLPYISCFLRNAAGVLEPEWEGSTEVLWDTQRPIDESKPFICGGCDMLLAVDDLIVPDGA